MTEKERYNRDKASVMAMIKYILFVLIAIVLVFGATRLILILVPFLVGFILAKTSNMIAKPIVKLISGKSAKKSMNPEKAHELTIKATSNAKPSIFQQIFRPNSDKPKRSLTTRISLVIYVLILLALLLVCVLCITEAVIQANNVIDKAVELTDDLDYENFNIDFLDQFSTENGGMFPPEILQMVEDTAIDFIEDIAARVPTVVSSAITWVWNLIGDLPVALFVIICVILSGYYFISDGPAVMKFYLKSVPNKSFRKRSFTLINDLSLTLFRVLGGYLSLLIITGVEAFLVYSIARVPYSVLFASITAILDFLPVLGIAVTFWPLIIYFVIKGNIVSAIILLVGMMLMTIIRRVIEPLILGKSMKIHPLFTLIGMIVGLYIWGGIGFLLGPTVLIIIIQIAKSFKIDKKFSSFLSRILENFMRDDDDDNNSDSSNDSKNSKKAKGASSDELTNEELDELEEMLEDRE